jgi:hypothetical protein
LVEVAFIAAVLALDRVSAAKNGVVDVPQHVGSGRLGRYASEYYSLLWTSLPSFLFNLYGLVWAMVVADSATRQPYVELMRRGPDTRGATPFRSIMLDYNAIPAWKSWVVALRNKQAHLGVGMLLALLVSNVLSSLAAHLLVQQQAQFSTTSPITSTSSGFDPSLLDSKTNLQPFIDVATAVQAYNTSPPAWTTETYAFGRFALTDKGVADSANVTANTSAYSARLECETIRPADYRSKLGELVDDTRGLTVDFTDRGCAVSQFLSLSPNTPTYAATWYARCPDSDVNRFGIFAGRYSASSATGLADLSVTSCVPTYWQTNGSLTMSYAATNGDTSSSAAYSYLDFDGHSRTQIDPGLQVVFEDALRDYTIFNPAAAAMTDAVGYAVYSAAQRRRTPQTGFPGAAAIRQSTQAVYATVFAAMTSSVLLPESGSKTSSDSGIVTTTKNRLFVASTIAYIFAASMAVVVACHVVLFWYGQRHHTPLDEEPVGLLGAAKFLRRSDLAAIVDDFEERHTRDGQLAHMQAYMRRHFPLRRSACWWDERERRIRVVGLTEE